MQGHTLPEIQRCFIFFILRKKVMVCDGYPPQFFARLASEPAVLVTVQASRGSVPREAGTWMAVFENGFLGTIGGGHLEFQAMAHARQCLTGGSCAPPVRYALGPTLGQCCGASRAIAFTPEPEGPRVIPCNRGGGQRFFGDFASCV